MTENYKYCSKTSRLCRQHRSGKQKKKAFHPKLAAIIKKENQDGGIGREHRGSGNRLPFLDFHLFHVAYVVSPLNKTGPG